MLCQPLLASSLGKIFESTSPEWLYFSNFCYWAMWVYEEPLIFSDVFFTFNSLLSILAIGKFWVRDKTKTQILSLLHLLHFLSNVNYRWRKGADIWTVWSLIVVLPPMKMSLLGEPSFTLGWGTSRLELHLLTGWSSLLNYETKDIRL